MIRSGFGLRSVGLHPVSADHMIRVSLGMGSDCHYYEYEEGSKPHA